MSHESVNADIEKILSDGQLSADERIDRLERMREGVRAEMRAATESGMAGDDDLGDDLKKLDEVLDELNTKPQSIEDTGAATL